MKTSYLILLVSLLGLHSQTSFADSIQPQSKTIKHGILLENQYCKKPLTPLFKQPLNVEQSAQLIELFEKMLCAKSDGDGNIPLGHLAEHIQNPISTYLALYSGMQNLGSWSLEDAQVLATTPADQFATSNLGLHIGGVIPTFSFWQVISATQVRIWYGPFKSAPSDALIYGFQYKNNAWVLTQVWMSSRI